MDPMEAVIGLVALTSMEIVLGIDNIVFIAILTGRLPEDQQALGRRIGLAAALVTRIMLLVALVWMLDPKNTLFTTPLFSLTSLGIPESLLTAKDGTISTEINEFNLHDLVLLAGGLFLIGKSVHEVHETMGEEEEDQGDGKQVSFVSVIIQVALLDVVFSLDSVITAVGMIEPEGMWVMITAIILAVAVMLLCAGKISRFIEENPTLKMLALSFLILIGVMLTAEAAGTHINKGYIYFAMAFGICVEFLNLRLRARQEAKKEQAEDSHDANATPAGELAEEATEVPADGADGADGADAEPEDDRNGT